MRLIDQIIDLPAYGESVNLRLPRPLESMVKMGRRELSKYRDLIHQWHADPSNGFGKDIYDKVDASGVSIVADDAAQWFFHHIDFKDFGFKSIPNATPPFNSFWVEARIPKLKTDIGVWVEATDLRERRKRNLLAKDVNAVERWSLRCHGMRAKHPGHELIVDDPIHITVDGQGRIVSCPIVTSLEYINIGILLTAVSFVHCKNVTLAPAIIPEKLNRRRLSANKPPLVRYRTLCIDGMKQVLQSEGRLGESGIKQALHICRGHFKTYSADRPLFGRFVGTVWVSQHARGNAERGVVVKGYAVKAPESPTRIATPGAESPDSTGRSVQLQVLHGAFFPLTTESASGDAGSGLTPAPAASCAESTSGAADCNQPQATHSNKGCSHPNHRSPAPAASEGDR